MNCKNCAFLLNQDDNYCPSCGGKVIHNRLTIKNLFEHFSEQFLNYDNKFLLTSMHLFTKPEVVIGGYIEGIRKKYVNAISYFAIAITFSGLQLFLINKFFPDAMDVTRFAAEGTQDFNSRLISFLQEYQTLVMMFYIPLYALLSKLVFLKPTKYNYTEHLVIFLYAQAQSSIFGFFFILLLLLFKIPFLLISFIYTFLMFIYMAFVLKRMYDLTLPEIILKALIFIMILVVLIILPSIAYGIYYGMKQAALKG